MTKFLDYIEAEDAVNLKKIFDQVALEKVAATLEEEKVTVAQKYFDRSEQPVKEEVEQIDEKIGHIAKGAFHRWLGKSEDEPITAADIARGKAAGGHAAKMATFAQNFGHRKEETELDEGYPTRKHFRMVADLIKTNADPVKRSELASHHAAIFAAQNPRFDRKKFMDASGVKE